MEQVNLSNRNFNTISPSAKWILLMKGHTDIPFARQTAELIVYPEKFNPDFDKKVMTFWARTVHFEYRYKSIDQLLEDLPVNNILELSSGYSFRGLNAIKQKDIYYIDTDLPDVIAEKEYFIVVLKNENGSAEGKLELLPLNALDEKQFRGITDRFPDGEIAIVNEGLLMYLDTSGKEKLCHIIHRILEERGGYWITADIYLKNQHENLGIKWDDRSQEFFEQHRIEDNKFGSFKEAEEFFKRMGFIIDKEAKIENSQLSSLKYLLQNATSEELTKMSKVGKIQSTWRLRIAKD
jgi:O-methyltransferase involved in polyketide biosynthesis